MRRVIAITGASGRLRKIASYELAMAGYTVYVGTAVSSSRTQAKAIRTFAEQNHVDLRQMLFDESSEASTVAAIQKIVKDCGRLDVLIHLLDLRALRSPGMRSAAELTQIYNNHVLKMQHISQAAMPLFIEQGHGLLMWVAGSQMRKAIPHDLEPFFASKAVLDALAISYAITGVGENIETTILLPGLAETTSVIVELVGMPAGTRPLMVYPDQLYASKEVLADRSEPSLALAFRGIQSHDLFRHSTPQTIDVYA